VVIAHVQNGFYFLSKIWHHHRPPRFPLRRENFGDSRTFNADIALLIFAWISGPPGLK